MKQYKNQPLNFAACCEVSQTMPHVRLETMVESVYSKNSRFVRRLKNKSALAWWRSQVSTDGMPWLYHCGGVA